jgi:hypothetical protein
MFVAVVTMGGVESLVTNPSVRALAIRITASAMYQASASVTWAIMGKTVNWVFIRWWGVDA